MPEIAFYYHTGKSVEETLPLLLEKSRERGWKAVVQAGSPQRLSRLDEHLWRYKAESFLPHGTKRDGAPETQPIYLTCEDDNPNGADVRFLLDGALIAPILSGGGAPKQRVVLMFDEADKDAARAQWAALRDAGATLVYFQQNERGGWIEKAREPKP